MSTPAPDPRRTELTDASSDRRRSNFAKVERDKHGRHATGCRQGVSQPALLGVRSIVHDSPSPIINLPTARTTSVEPKVIANPPCRLHCRQLPHHELPAPGAHEDDQPRAVHSRALAADAVAKGAGDDAREEAAEGKSGRYDAEAERRHGHAGRRAGEAWQRPVGGPADDGILRRVERGDVKAVLQLVGRQVSEVVADTQLGLGARCREWHRLSRSARTAPATIQSTTSANRTVDDAPILQVLRWNERVAAAASTRRPPPHVLGSSITALHIARRSYV